MSGAQIAASAKSKIGCEYQWGGVGPDKFDCSGLAVWAHKQHGIAIPRTSGAQAQGGKAVKVPQAGDLLLFSAEPDSNEIKHTAICTGNGKMVHAANELKPVQEVTLSDYWTARLKAVRRYWEE